VQVLLQHIDSTKNSSASGGWQAILDAETDIPEVRETLAASRLSTVFWFVAARAARWCAQILYRIHISGVEKIPQDRPFILAPNHQSFIDAPLLMSYFPFRVFRKMFYVGTSELFGAGIRRRIAKTMRLVPVDPDANLVPAMRAGAYGLRRGDALALYPEGERSIDGEPKTFKKGAAILSTHLQVPIVPVALDGFHKAWGRGQGIKFFQRLQIRIGDAIEPPPASTASEKTYAKLTAELRDRVLRMWTQLRGQRHEEPELAATRE
jgi:long-chain acyl-CoA synthetase